MPGYEAALESTLSEYSMCQFESKNSAKLSLTSIAQNLVNLASRERNPSAKNISTGELYIKIFCIVAQDCPCTYKYMHHIMLSHLALSLMFQLFLHGTLMILQKKLDLAKGQLTY